MATRNKSKIVKDLSFNYPVTWFTDPSNIPNQELVQKTIQWFETGPGQRAYAPLEFLNLLYKQFRFVIENIYDAEVVSNHFRTLPLSPLQKHILTGFVLKWTGGYPVRSAEREQEPTLKGIEEIFLTGEPDSPEREFCKADMNVRKQFIKLGLAFTGAINNGIDVNEFLKEMDGNDREKQFERFEDLFREATLMEAVGPFKTKNQYVIQEKSCNYRFNCWLAEFKGWTLGDESTYKPFLNRITFQEYLRYERKDQQLKQDNFAAEKLLWQLDDSNDLTAEKNEEVAPLLLHEMTVRKQLTQFKPLFQSDEQFNQAVYTISNFLNIRQSHDVKQVFVRKGKIRRIAYALGEIWRNTYNDAIPLSYLKMCRNLFSVFSTQEIEDSTYKTSNLHKYFISPT
ncbi:hypothetical protein [Chitinophaga filiformis]|uniref:Uncharacterized protein n=1 Tax=Chitinophaga filiformis TaxID=104663 RepID=A0ABY4I8I2_CHIFI|nr:hypothetical protein [Chitinophaga filiformis]UPK71393.1 hypothetical protein MYF79_08895 [Chitinophaga filiformis]